MDHSYVTDQLGIAAYLATVGFKLQGTEPNPRKPLMSLWRFDDPERKAAEAVDRYYHGALVEALVYDSQISMFKGTIWKAKAGAR